MSNPFQESERLRNLENTRFRLTTKRMHLLLDLHEQKYYNMDDTHLRLLKDLKEMDDELKKIESDIKYITGTQTSDTVHDIFKQIDDMFEDDPVLTADDWKELKSLGKKT